MVRECDPDRWDDRYGPCHRSGSPIESVQPRSGETTLGSRRLASTAGLRSHSRVELLSWSEKRVTRRLNRSAARIRDLLPAAFTLRPQEKVFSFVRRVTRRSKRPFPAARALQLGGANFSKVREVFGGSNRAVGRCRDPLISQGALWPGEKPDLLDEWVSAVLQGSVTRLRASLAVGEGQASIRANTCRQSSCGGMAA